MGGSARAPARGGARGKKEGLIGAQRTTDPRSALKAALAYSNPASHRGGIFLRLKNAKPFICRLISTLLVSKVNCLRANFKKNVVA
jgi:hypothetical protein